jgi:hypothetical protein
MKTDKRRDVKAMYLCPECHALMWGENCINPNCEQHYREHVKISDR